MTPCLGNKDRSVGLRSFHIASPSDDTIPFVFEANPFDLADRHQARHHSEPMSLRHLCKMEEFDAIALARPHFDTFILRDEDL